MHWILRTQWMTLEMMEAWRTKGCTITERQKVFVLFVNLCIVSNFHKGDDPLEHAVNLNIFGRGPIHLDIPHTLRSLQTDKDYAKPLVPPPSQLSLPSVQPAPPLSDIISPTPRTRSSQATPAHILTASAPICKDLVERLCTRHVETGTFERLTAPTPTPHPEFKYSLPLQEIDILVGGFNREAGIIDLGSQVVVIRKDLADEVAARINPGVRLEMK